MASSLAELYQLQKKDIESAAEMYSRAYADYPFNIYFSKDKNARTVLGRDFYILGLRLGLKFGEAYAPTPNMEGVAVWEYSHKKPGALQIFREGALKMLPHLGLKNSLKGFMIFKYCEERRGKIVSEKHIHLSSLGVDPEHQGKGYSSELLRAMFRRLDQEKVPCVLETQTEKNVKLYSHIGFRVVDETMILKTGIPNWLMVRVPE